MREALAGALAATPPVVGCHVSHVYPDGASLYFTVFARQDADDPVGQWRAAKRAAGDAIAAAGATITHHHAVGRDHAPGCEAEHGALGIEVLRAAQAALRPGRDHEPGQAAAGLAAPAGSLPAEDDPASAAWRPRCVSCDTTTFA